MKKEIISTAFIVTLLLTSSSSFGQASVKESRDVDNFTRVSFGVPGNLYIKVGPTFRFEIEGTRRVLDEIETEVSGDRLAIKLDNWRFSFNNEKVTVNITMPEVEGLSVSGSGKAEMLDAIEADDLDLSVSGSGRLQVGGLNADRLKSSISGSGDIILSGPGSVDNGEISISGSGGFNGEAVEIDHLHISVSGSGDCYCKVGDSLDAGISGSGNVTYSGNPKVNARVSGSGHVRSR